MEKKNLLDLARLKGKHNLLGGGNHHTGYNYYVNTAEENMRQSESASRQFTSSGSFPVSSKEEWKPRQNKAACNHPLMDVIQKGRTVGLTYNLTDGTRGVAWEHLRTYCTGTERRHSIFSAETDS